MKGILYFFWGFVLLALLNAGWVITGFNWSNEVKAQAQHVDDWMNNRGVYGQRP